MQIWWSGYVQPVIINRFQWVDSWWLSKVVVLLFMVTLLPVMASHHFSIFSMLLISMPMLIVVMRQTLVSATGVDFKINANVISLGLKDKQTERTDTVRLTVAAYWQLPMTLMVKFNSPGTAKPFYISFFRFKMNEEQFAHLISKIKQIKRQEVVL